MSAVVLGCGTFVDPVSLQGSVVICVNDLTVHMPTEAGLALGMTLLRCVGIAQTLAGVCQEMLRATGHVDVEAVLRDLAPSCDMNGLAVGEIIRGLKEEGR